MAGEPTPTDEQPLGATSSEWVARPWASRLIRGGVTVVPIVASALITRFIASVWTRPESLPGTIAWFVAMLAIALVVVAIFDNLARRVLPLAALMQLTLIFPDEAPSRFSVAMRSGTTRQLERKLDDIEHGTHTASDASHILLELVSALRTHDRLTRGHSERVRAYTDLVANEMGLSGELRSKLHWAGLLHDIGKLRVPSEILNKKGRPTEDEWHILRQHPAEGAKLAAPLKGFLGESFAAIEQHHERWDGCGYPKGLSGADISLAARIVSVVDTYDVMTSVRSYKPARKPQDARAELAACAGTQFDPIVVRAFLNVSLGRLRLAMGPLSWLAQGWIGGMAQAPVQTVLASGQAATAASVLAAGSMAAPGMVNPDAFDAPAVDHVLFQDPGDIEVANGTALAPSDPVPQSSTTRRALSSANSAAGDVASGKAVKPVVVSGQNPLSGVERSTSAPETSTPTTIVGTPAPPTTIGQTSTSTTTPPTTIPATTLPPTTTVAPTTTLPVSTTLPPSGTVADALKAAKDAEKFEKQSLQSLNLTVLKLSEVEEQFEIAEEAMVSVVVASLPAAIIEAAGEVFAAASAADEFAKAAEVRAGHATGTAASAQAEANIAAAAAANNPGSSAAAQAAADAQAAATQAATNATSASQNAASARSVSNQIASMGAQAQAIVNAL